MYKLRDDGYANFKKIINGRKWVGRVSQTASGFFAKIGDHEADALTEIAALQEVVAKVKGQLFEANPKSRAGSRRTSTVQADTERVIKPARWTKTKIKIGNDAKRPAKSSNKADV
jgi:hypothetical protein